MFIDYPAPPPPPPPARFSYHWSPLRQRRFLEHLAATGSVTHSAALVGISPRAAYDLRQRRDGLLFGVGWGAAVLLARHRLTDLLLERAIDGVEEVAVRTADRDDGSAEYRRRKFDGRLGLGMLARLDRMATPPTDGDQAEAALHRAVAQDFENFLDRLCPPYASARPPADAAPAEAEPTDAEPVDSAPAAVAMPTPPAAAPVDGEAPDQRTARAAPAPAQSDAAIAEAHALLAADALRDAEARVAMHLAALADGGGPLARLARDSGVHCEVAQKSATSEAEDADEEGASWVPTSPGIDRSCELQTEIHDCLDRIEDQRAAAGLAAFDASADSIGVAVALAELTGVPEAKCLPMAAYLIHRLEPYSAAWQAAEPGVATAPDGGPPSHFATRETRREDSIRARIERLVAIGNARMIAGASDLAEAVAAADADAWASAGDPG